MAWSWLETDLRPRLVLDRDCRIVWRNAAAAQALDARQLITIKGDRLTFASDLDEAKFNAAFQSASGQVQRLMLVPDSSTHNAVGIDIQATEQSADRRVLLNVKLARPTLGVTESGMTAHYRLTKSEADVVERLLRIESPAAVARHQQVSLHTVRSHLRAIYAKTGVGTQAELMQLTQLFCRD